MVYLLISIIVIGSTAFVIMTYWQNGQERTNELSTIITDTNSSEFKEPEFEEPSENNDQNTELQTEPAETVIPHNSTEPTENNHEAPTEFELPRWPSFPFLNVNPIENIPEMNLESQLIESDILQSYLKPNLYLNGKLYVVWMEESEENYYAKIKAYNYTTETWSPEYTISTLQDNDDHKVPSIGYTSDKHLLVCYGTHMSEDFWYRYSINIEDESSWSEEKTVDIGSGGYSFTYPNPCSFDDKIMIFHRSYIDSPNATEHQWIVISTTENTPEPDDWSITQVINNDEEGVPYMSFQRIEDYIIMVGAVHDRTTDTRKNLYFMYSPDEGTTWKLANGTIKSLPVNLSDTKVITDTTSDLPYIIYGCLDENNKPIIVTQIDGDDVKIAHYSEPLGEPDGSWIFETCIDESGDVITNRRHWVDVMLSPVYERPIIWVVDEEDYYLKCYVRKADETGVWELVYEETSRDRYDFAGPNFIKESDRPPGPWSFTQEENDGLSNLWVYGFSTVE